MPILSAQIQTILDTECGSLLQQMREAGKRPHVGIAVALYYPADPTVPSFYSYGEAAPGQPINRDTIFAIGSVTKVFTATLASYLQVTQVIGGLDLSVAPFLSNPDCSPPGIAGGGYMGTVTFENLATQTSGMGRTAPHSPSVPLFDGQPPTCEMLDWWRTPHPEFRKDQGSWVYSNAGFVTLGFAVANAAKQAYSDLLSSVITTPLGMPNTFCGQSYPVGVQVAQGYQPGGAKGKIETAADLKSTAGDLGVWMQAVYQAMENGADQNQLQRAIAQTTKVWVADPVSPTHDKLKFQMGLAWQIPTLGSGTTALAKDGSVGGAGFSCWLGITQPGAGNRNPVGIALLTNQTGVAPDPSAFGILNQIAAIA